MSGSPRRSMSGDDSPTSDEASPRPSLPAHLRLFGRALVVLAVLAVPLLATREGCRGHAAGRPRHNLAAALAARTGLAVAPAEVALLDPTGAGPLAARTVVFLGRAAPDAPRDLYAARVQLADGAIPVELSGPWNLSRTKEADETDLVHRGTRVACASRLAGRVEAVLVYDLAGEGAEVTAGWPLVERTLDRVTNLQETGTFAGVGRTTLELAAATERIDLGFEADGLVRLETRGDARAAPARFDPRTGAVTSGGDAVRVMPREKGRRGSHLTWAVDTVRNLSFVGPERIAHLEYLVFKLMDQLQVVGAKVTRYDGAAAIVQDLDLKPEEPPPAPGSPAAPTVPGWPPKDLQPILTTPMHGEGHWVLLRDPYTAQQPGLPPPFAETFLRVDAERAFARVYLVAWDPRRLDLHLVPGTTDPEPASGKPGSGRIPRDGPDRERLAAAFSGGWQTVHGHFGMRAQGRTIVTPAGGLATFGRLHGGATGFGTWPKGLRQTPPEIVEFRQNLYPLFEGGVLNPGGHAYWGGAHSSELELNYIRRSALCATREQHVVFFYGESVTAYTLALAMQRAGCDYGLELDINRPNVSFEFYRVIRKAEARPTDPPPGVHEVRSRAAGEMPGRKDFFYFVRSLARGQGLGGFPRYISTMPRDFVYLTLRDLLPGPDLAVPIAPRLPGEGAWQTAGLPQGPEPFPAALAMTTVRPDPARPAVSVRLVAIDLRRVDLAVGAAPPAGTVLCAAHLGGAGQVQALAAGDAGPDAHGLLVEGGGDLPPRAITGALGRARVEEPATVLRGTPVHPDAAPPPAGDGSLLAACARDSFLLLAQAPAEDEAAAARALKLAGCEAVVRVSEPRGSGHLVVRGVDRTKLAPGERALYVMARPRPGLQPLFAKPPVADDAAPKKKVDGEAILKRAMLRHKPGDEGAKANGPR
jgi:hypothetical protein